MRSSRVRGLPLFAFAVAGLLAGHGLSYLVAVPDPHHRDLLLDHTGHAYLPAAGRLSLVLLLAAAATIVGRALSSRGPETVASVPTLALRLGLVQVAAFVGLEVLERILSGAPLDTLAGGLLVVGIAAQLVVAAVGAALLRWLIGASSRLADLHATTPFPPRVRTLALTPAPTDLPLGAPVLVAQGPRAPPAV